MHPVIRICTDTPTPVNRIFCFLAKIHFIKVIHTLPFPHNVTVPIHFQNTIAMQHPRCDMWPFNFFCCKHNCISAFYNGI